MTNSRENHISGLAVLLLFPIVTATIPAVYAGTHAVGQVIVRIPADRDPNHFTRNWDRRLFPSAKTIVPSLNILLVKTVRSLTVEAAIDKLKESPGVIYAQPDHIVTRREIAPDDPLFDKQWSLYNPETGADIGAVEAWALCTGGIDAFGEDITVAVVDGGMDIAHGDLRPNLWVNPGEIAGNNEDDDGNGYIDDVHGWNAYKNSGSIPADEHGTHTAGIIGARGNNGLGVAGVNWSVRIMPVAAASNTTSTVLAGYGYVLTQKRLWLESGGRKGANIVATNSSFGVDGADCRSGSYPAWDDVYEAMGRAGILSAVATTNRRVNVDVVGDVPSGCRSNYIVSVTNTTGKDELNPHAGYGAKSIHLGAPGTAILSTVPGAQYALKTGTSMATPHVGGAIAFLHSVAGPSFAALHRRSPYRAALAVKKAVLEGVTPLEALENITASGGRLNLFQAASRLLDAETKGEYEAFALTPTP